MTDKYHSDNGRKTESICYSTGLQTSGDLEAGTKTITRTAEVSGLVNADYSAALTLPVPSDERLAITRVGARSQVVINSNDGVHDLRCRVYVDVQDTDHLLFDLTYAAIGTQNSAVDTLAGVKEIIFNLLKDGAAHTFYFFLWTPGNHIPVISLAQVWEAVGTCSTSFSFASFLQIKANGFVTLSIYGINLGGGSGTFLLSAPGQPTGSWGALVASASIVGGNYLGVPMALCNDSNIAARTTGGTDLLYMTAIYLGVRGDN
jgi:hypothetical protein